ncbi:MAG: proline iminopeptidase-family hydrolase [Gemmatimonadota bacterium]|nr:proline iminopeptidase-family hydrolase [Gemmatimonadota bacterium]
MTTAMLPATTSATVPFGPWHTWYRITGDLASGLTPLVAAHGGPGCTHDYLLTIADIAQSGRPVIHYDQLGNGHSTHLRDKGADFWTVDLFLDELDNLLAHLGIADRYHLLGQSWGGMLGAEHALRRPNGLRSLIIADSPASMQLWLEAAAVLRAELPRDVQDTLTRHEADGTTESAEYIDAMNVFYARHVCRVVPHPPELARTFQAMADDPTVYHTMNGPSEFHVIGTLKTWSVVDRVHDINVPTLLISGRWDEAAPSTVQPFADNIPDVEWHVFENSSHVPHIEERDAYMEVVNRFLDQHERA